MSKNKNNNKITIKKIDEEMKELNQAIIEVKVIAWRRLAEDLDVIFWAFTTSLPIGLIFNNYPAWCVVFYITLLAAYRVPRFSFLLCPTPDK